MAAVVPKADATLLIYFNFEDGVLDSTVDTASDQTVAAGGDNPGGGIQGSTLDISTLTGDATVAGLAENRSPGDIDTNDLALGLRTTPLDNGSYIQFAVNATEFSAMSLSFAINTQGNGFNTVAFSYSTDGTNFTPVGSQFIPSGGGAQIITFALPSDANGEAGLVLRLTFDGGTSSGQNLQTVIDNIQLTGAPEPATVVGGLLGAFGLCWHQRRRLIRSLRLRRV